MLRQDKYGEPLAVGDRVEVLSVPDALTDGLPIQDANEIREQIGSTLFVQGFDIVGNVELEFQSDGGISHTVWISPECLKKAV